MRWINSPVRIASLVLVGIGVGLLALNIFQGGTLNVALPLVFLMLGGVFCLLAASAIRPMGLWPSLLFIPGGLLLTLGLVFLLNVITRDWNAWAYAWLIVAAGLGAGMVLASRQQSWPSPVGLVGWGLALGGITLAVVFGAIAGGLFIQVMAPILLILGGLSLRWLPLERILPESIRLRLQRAPHPEMAAPLVEAVPQPVRPAQPPAPPALVEPLSPRELEVLRLVEQGLSNQQIATRLSVAASTVKTHINNIYGKMAVESRLQAVNRARELGLL